jgi:hypothetical protein
MSNESPDKRIPIRTKGRKGVRTSEPVAVHVGSYVPSVETDNFTPSLNTNKINPSSTLETNGSFEPHTVKTKDGKSLNVAERPTIQTVVETQVGEGESSQPSKDDFSSEGKRKTPPLTMVDFISQAYARKGQRVGLTSKQEKSLSANHKLDQEALIRLLDLAKQDRLLQVPRQLLLTSRNIQSHPLPRKVLVDFVQAVIKQHPICNLELVLVALEDDKQMPSLYSLYQSIKSYSPLYRITDEHLENSDLEKLKINTLNLMTVWLFHVRNVRIDEIVAVLLQIIWKPAAEKLETESQLIRALTELEELEAIGWVAERYQKNVVEAQDAEQRAHNEAVNFRTEAASLRESLNIEIARSTYFEEQLSELQRTMDKTVSELQETIRVTRVHLSHDIEIIRGRLIESLQMNIERLQTGLSAINQEVPLIQVMTQRAEIVIDDLQSELKKLERKI